MFFQLKCGFVVSMPRGACNPSQRRSKTCANAVADSRQRDSNMGKMFFNFAEFEKLLWIYNSVESWRAADPTDYKLSIVHC